uniref:Uncharacterized protein n=1 Tax=Arcella intermedia TaxID=1963864 RepID=A0A6B2LG18_9EUKA
MLVSVDNWGVLRPTKAIPDRPLPHERTRSSVQVAPNFECNFEDRPDWKTADKWLHWDLNPFMWCKGRGLDYVFEGDFVSENNGTSYKGYPKVQGFLNLIDASVEDGGFLVVPGFHHRIRDWVSQPHLSSFELSQEAFTDLVYVPPDDPIHQQTQKIPLRAGHFIIWNSELPHQNFPNDSTNFRMVQYIKMFPNPPQGSYGLLHRTHLLKLQLPKHLQQTPTAKSLFGL